MNVAHFEKVPFPGMSAFHITDNYGHTAQLSAEQAYELLQWLYEQRDSLLTSIHPVKKELPSWVTPETLQAWKKARTAVERYNREHPFVSTEQEEDNEEYGDEDL